MVLSLSYRCLVNVVNTRLRRDLERFGLFGVFFASLDCGAFFPYLLLVFLDFDWILFRPSRFTLTESTVNSSCRSSFPVLPKGRNGLLDILTARGTPLLRHVKRSQLSCFLNYNLK